MKIITVRVTKADIKLGIRNSCRKCPVARAVRRRTRRPWIIQDGYNVEYGDWKLPLPKTATNFIGQFDASGGAKLKPFTFKIKLP